MEKNIVFFEGQVLWSQLDPNMHLRHSAYADFGAQARSNMLNSVGLSLAAFSKYSIGPILFREELVYFREIGIDERVQVTVELLRFNLANDRFSFRHNIFKENGVKSATIIVDGAWMNLKERKLTKVPSEWDSILQRIPRAEDYEEIPA